MSQSFLPHPRIQTALGTKTITSSFEVGAYSIRPATFDDLEILCAIENAVFTDDIYRGSVMSRRQFRYLLCKGNALFLVAETKEKICGYALLLFRKNAISARLYSLAVFPEFQGHGIGNALFDCIERICADLGLVRIYLEAREDNTASLDWYKRRGFKVYKRIEGYYGDDGAAAYKMVAPVVTVLQKAPE